MKRLKPNIFFYRHGVSKSNLRGLSQESVIFLAFIVTVVSFLGVFIVFIQSYGKNNIHLNNSNNINIVSAEGFLTNNYIYKIVMDLKISNKNSNIIPDEITIVMPNGIKSICARKNAISISNKLYGCISLNNFKSTKVVHDNELYDFYVYVNERNELVIAGTIYEKDTVRHIIFKGIRKCSQLSNTTICCLVERMALKEEPLLHYIIANPIIVLHEIDKSLIRLYILISPIPLSKIPYINIYIAYGNKVEGYIVKPSAHIINNKIIMVIEHG